MTATGSIRIAGVLLGLGILLGVSIFLGTILVTAGGALYPPIYLAGASLVCDGELVIESETYSYKPGQRGVQYTIFCVDAQAGVRTEMTLYAIAGAVLVYSGAFAVVLAPPSVALVRAVKARTRDVSPPRA